MDNKKRNDIARVLSQIDGSKASSEYEDIIRDYENNNTTYEEAIKKVKKRIKEKTKDQYDNSFFYTTNMERSKKKK